MKNECHLQNKHNSIKQLIDHKIQYTSSQTIHVSTQSRRNTEKGLVNTKSIAFKETVCCAVHCTDEVMLRAMAIPN